ncbi:hypothetical protein FLAT13_03610 [Flavobacterium salmonis]|uniref:Uncharacterized protein n=1 Tax=Flavobacterium salmonis TaxID=2654844 RepID=A0A6V6Z5U4_9FLAO|nr:hypothetical protein FLAT13_03610 [Flavobacterium salmonis]
MLSLEFPKFEGDKTLFPRLSFTALVPPSVPSVFYNEAPVVPSFP